MISYRQQKAQTLAVFNCRGALALYKSHRESHGVFIPVERIRRVHAKSRKVSVVEYAAISGLVFVPSGNAPDFRRRVPETHRIRQMFTPLGTARVVTMGDLLCVQQMLNEEFAGPKRGEPGADDTVWFKRGDVVTLMDSAMSGLEGIVERIKPDGIVRLSMASALGVVEIHKRFLQIS